MPKRKSENIIEPSLLMVPPLFYSVAVLWRFPKGSRAARFDRRWKKTLPRIRHGPVAAQVVIVTPKLFPSAFSGGCYSHRILQRCCGPDCTAEFTAEDWTWIQSNYWNTKYIEELQKQLLFLYFRSGIIWLYGYITTSKGFIWYKRGKNVPNL